MTPETVRTGLLEPALDARALNLQQDRLIANPTAEVDSVIEHLAELHRHATSDTQRHHITQVAQLVDTLLISNRVEGGLEQQIAGRADTLAAALQCDQVTGGHWSSLATSGCTCPSRSAGFCKHQIAVRASLMLNDQLPEWGCEPVAVPA